MNGHEIRELASMLPSPAARELPDGRANVLRAHLLTEVRRAPEQSSAAPRRVGRRQVRRSRIAIAGACALATAAATGSFALVSGTHSPSASPAAVTLLAMIASAADRQPSPRVGDNDFEYIRSEVAFASYDMTGSQQPVMDKLHERQVWISATNDCITGLLIEEGERTPLSPYPVINGKVQYPKANGKAQRLPSSGPAGTVPAGEPVIHVNCAMGDLGYPTYRLLQSLPTDPRALLDYIYAATKGEGQAMGPDGEAFSAIGDMIKENILPPRIAAALYRAAALIPGVTLVGHVTNAVGRPGVAVAWADAYERSEWIFDPTTLQYIGERDYDLQAHQVVGNTAILQKAYVAKVGQLPGH